jgi:2-(1,2-epoxy-1,2-dihydrophenyl)acetyl-CoA isomerase
MWRNDNTLEYTDLRMGYSTILVDRADGVVTITLNRPEARNAIDLVMRRELLAALDELEADPGTRILILTGAGGHFSAGGDVKTMAARRQTAAEGRARVESLNRFVIRLFEYPKPTIAMVDGFAVGAGCNIALGCDLVIASDRARFGEVFARIGLVPDGGGTWLLPRLVGLAKAKELVFSADIIDAAEALRIGLVNRVVPAAELEPVTRALATRIAAGPPNALSLAKALLNRSATVDLATALGFEAYAQAQTITTDDHAEGVRAFLEKRPPRFTGQ